MCGFFDSATAAAAASAAAIRTPIIRLLLFSPSIVYLRVFDILCYFFLFSYSLCVCPYLSVIVVVFLLSYKYTRGEKEKQRGRAVLFVLIELEFNFPICLRIVGSSKGAWWCESVSLHSYMCVYFYIITSLYIFNA